MYLVCLSDNRLFAVACVYMWETQVMAEDGAREFPQFCLWPHSVFTQLLFCVCAPVLHTRPPKEADSVKGTQQREVKHSNSKVANQMAEGQLTVLFLLSSLYVELSSHNFVLSRK